MNVNKLIGRNVELTDGNTATVIDAFKDFRDRDVITVKFNDGSESNIYPSEVKTLKMESNMDIGKDVKYVNYKGKYYKVNHALGKDAYGQIEIVNLKDPSLGRMVDPNQVRPASQNQIDAIERIYGGSDMAEESLNELESNNMNLKDVLNKAKGSAEESGEMPEKNIVAEENDDEENDDEEHVYKKDATVEEAYDYLHDILMEWGRNELVEYILENTSEEELLQWYHEDHIDWTRGDLDESIKHKFKEAKTKMSESTNYQAFDFCNSVILVNDKVMDVSNNKVGHVSEIIENGKIKVKMGDKYETHLASTVMKI